MLGTDGSIAATYYYDAFGNITEQTVTGNVYQPIKYAGYYFDDETGLYYLNARYYDPVTARFLSEDTYRGNLRDPLSLNLHTYVHNEPMMYIDPTGFSDVGVRASNESQGNTVTWARGNTSGKSTITINQLVNVKYFSKINFSSLKGQ